MDSCIEYVVIRAKERAAIWKIIIFLIHNEQPQGILRPSGLQNGSPFQRIRV
jgi:hypothetical protein